MPQVVAVAVAAFQAAAAVATTVGTAMGLSGLAATVAGAASIISSTTQMWSAVSSAIGSKPKVNAATTQLQTKVGAVTPRAIIMGRTAVAGTLLTPTPLQSGRGNALATNFYALSHAGPSGVVESVQWGDDTVTFDGQGQAIGKYANNMWLFQKNGSWSQTSITFTGTPGIGADTPTQWDSTKRAQGCLVVALVVRYAASVLANNMQTPLFVVDANAVALTDPRTGTSATTQAQRRNPAVWAYSWRLGWFQNSKRVIGLGQPAAELHAAGYAYAANVADANSWTISGEASTADDRYAVEMAILQACASVPVERNGLQSVVTSATRSSVGTITSNDLRADPKWRYNTQQSSRPTAIQTRYRSETNRWQMVEGAEVTDASWLAQDAGREKRIMVEYAYAGGGSAHVGHLACLDITNAREPLIFNLQCKQQARYAGFVGDAVTVSLPEIGLSSTKMVIVSRVVNADGTVDYELLVETDAKYAFAADRTSAAPSFTLQPGFDIYSVPQPGAAEWASVAAQITSGATSLPIVRVTGSAADYSFCTGVVFKIRLNSGGSPWLVSEDAPPAATQHEFRGLTNATGYIVGVAYRGVTGIEGPVRELAAVTTGVMVSGEAGSVPWPGVTSIPKDVTSSASAINPNGQFANYLANGVPPGWSNWQNGAAALSIAGLGSNQNRLDLTAGAGQEAGFLVDLPASVPAGYYVIELAGALFSGTWDGAGAFFFRVNAFSDYVELRCAVDADLGGLTGNSVGGLRIWRKFVYIGNTTGNTETPRFYFANHYTGIGSIASANRIVWSQAEIRPATDQEIRTFGMEDGADVTGANVAAGFIGQGNQAGVNRYRQSSAPGTANEGDIWEDTSTTPVRYKKRMSGVWVFQAEEAADVTAGKVAAGFIGQGNIAGTNIYRQSTPPSSPQENDLWEDTSTSPVSYRRRISGAWVFQGEEGADITIGKTAAAITGQGNNATKNTNAGALASRPTGVDGDTYHATDTKEIYFKTGGSWVKVADVGNTFSVSLSATNIIATGTGTTLTTGNVTATPSGGTGPYTYAWTVITKDVQSLDPFMTSQSATTACRVTLGAGQAVEGTIQLIVTDTGTGAIVIKTLTYNITNTA